MQCHLELCTQPPSATQATMCTFVSESIRYTRAWSMSEVSNHSDERMPKEKTMQRPKNAAFFKYTVWIR
jgi:hypothetical protein